MVSRSTNDKPGDHHTLPSGWSARACGSATPVAPSAVATRPWSPEQAAVELAVRVQAGEREGAGRARGHCDHDLSVGLYRDFFGAIIVIPARNRS